VRLQAAAGGPGPHEQLDGLDLPTVPRLAVIGLAILAVVAWLVLAVAHLDDRYNVNAVSGTLLALADRAREGVLYPPLFDGQSYGGTRTMPLPILLYAAAISLGGDFLAPAKIVDLLASAALVVLLVGVLRHLGATTAMRLGLASTVVTSQVFLLVAAGIRPEALPTALQLGAVSLVAVSPRRSATVLAAVLCAVAIFTKVSAVWAPAAIVLWLLVHDRGRLVLFGGALVVVATALIGAFSVASDGRMLTNLLGLGGAGLSVIGVLKAPLKGIELLAQYAQATFVLLPALLLGGLLLTRDARPTIFQVGLVAATAVLLVAMADVGSDYNHLLDVVVLVPIVAFELLRAAARRVADPRLVWAALTAAILVGSTAALAMNAGASLAATLGLPGSSQTAGNDPHPLEDELRAATSVLAEDPYVNLARGERPVVVDPFMFIRIARRDPGLVEPFLDRVRGQGFDAVVLSRDLGQPDAEAWFSEFSFGQPFYEAMRDRYQLCAAVDGAFLYVPDSRSCPS
jgi:hypothetical protein